ncbi:hypothetical protein, partial [Marinovum sp. 1_MG-2023]|uniref:hypothetical protein n=1 Tax=Marinovum sp. 1_MG-2023 TaxID=3062633 RepID=UPI0026E1633B
TPWAQDHPPALTALSATSSLALKHCPQARRLVDRALMLDPNNAGGWLRLGWTAVERGDVDVGLAAVDRYVQLSPLDPFL